jgi:hypothetical protein
MSYRQFTFEQIARTFEHEPGDWEADEGVAEWKHQRTKGWPKEEWVMDHRDGAARLNSDASVALRTSRLLSTPEQAKGDSLRRQTEKTRAYVEAHGLELDTTLTAKMIDRGARSRLCNTTITTAGRVCEDGRSRCRPGANASSHDDKNAPVSQIVSSQVLVHRAATER